MSLYTSVKNYFHFTAEETLAQIITKKLTETYSSILTLKIYDLDIRDFFFLH